MSELLDLAIAAHGGKARWQSVTSVTARLSVAGALFALKGQQDTLRDVEVSVDRSRPRTVYAPFPAQGQRGVFEPDRVSIETVDGKLLEERSDPRAACTDAAREGPWDHLHLLYFAGYAMWNYLCTPFMLAQGGVESREIEPRDEDGERWRRLQVRFPVGFPTHCQDQVFCFSERGLLRRLDYVPEPAGALARPAAHYCFDHQTFSGLTVPTRRRVFPKQADGMPQRELTAVSLDLADIRVS